MRRCTRRNDLYTAITRKTTSSVGCWESTDIPLRVVTGKSKVDGFGAKGDLWRNQNFSRASMSGKFPSVAFVRAYELNTASTSQ